MKVSREQMQANRRRILDAASRQFRERGFDAVSVADVMKAAGLTHGGFYGHFASKDDLIAQAVAHTFEVGETGAGDLAAFVNAYLAPQHRDDVGKGCPTAALISDVRRQDPAARLAMTEGIKRQIARIGSALSASDRGDARRQAIGIWASLVGAVLLARTIEDPALSDEVLRETQAWIEGKAERP